LFDVVPAYASAGVFFDPDVISTPAVMAWLTSLPHDELAGSAGAPGRAFRVPVCYELQLDLARVCEATGRMADEVIQLHTAPAYTVHAIGFAPGFPYLGYLPAELCGVGRLPSPRTRVEPGSVGLTARQTGIYPLPRPAGWNLIGRTPLVIVDVASGFFPLRVGDTVRFERIDETRYRELEGERLGQ
jgi:inhibitor of KinA